jgi:hypothetical protein
MVRACAHPRIIITEPGIGYRFIADNPPAGDPHRDKSGRSVSGAYVSLAVANNPPR